MSQSIDAIFARALSDLSRQLLVNYPVGYCCCDRREDSIVEPRIASSKCHECFLTTTIFDLPQMSALTGQAARERGQRSLSTQTLVRLNEPLHMESALVVSDSDGKPLITDGPFAETKEQLIC